MSDTDTITIHVIILNYVIVWYLCLCFLGSIFRGMHILKLGRKIIRTWWFTLATKEGKALSLLSAMQWVSVCQMLPLKLESHSMALFESLEGRRRENSGGENYIEKGEIFHIFWKNNFLENDMGEIFHILWKSNLLKNDILMLMINIFLIWAWWYWLGTWECAPPWCLRFDSL